MCMGVRVCVCGEIEGGGNDKISKVGDLKASFSIATTPRCRGGLYSIPWLLHFTPDPYLIMLNVKQGGIKYHL